MTGNFIYDIMQVAEALSRTKDMAVEAHARDELGIDLEDLDEKTNPWQVRFITVSAHLLHIVLRGMSSQVMYLELNGSPSIQLMHKQTFVVAYMKWHQAVIRQLTEPIYACFSTHRGVMQAAIASMISFTVGGIIPLLGGVFIRDPRARLASVAVSLPS